MQEQYLKEAEVSRLLGVSVSKLRHDRMQGVGIPHCKYGRHCRYRMSDIESYMEANRIETNNISNN